jgi:hypothetical protein
LTIELLAAVGFQSEAANIDENKRRRYSAQLERAIEREWSVKR